MDELSSPGAMDRVPAGPFPLYPADKLEKEQAVFDLTDAAQADTRAATALERGDLAESRRLSRLAQSLYNQAETHRRHACEGQGAASQTAAATPGEGSRSTAANRQHELPQAHTRRQATRETGERTMTIHNKVTPNPHTPEIDPAPGTAPAGGGQERNLRNELTRIQDQLTAEDRATGARPSPGSTRRRAELLRREREVIRELRAQKPVQRPAPQ